ncbi:hypothetical protein [Streptomyces sp. NPDC096030]|uniref:hypothetical protein n=1 Tax=Streptomyces sp. NPDC096030 TaxID=3155423 RepID=UPI00332B7A93
MAVSHATRFHGRRTAWSRQGAGLRVVAVALPARLGVWAETTPIVVDNVPALNRLAELAFCDTKVFVAAPDAGSFECWWVRPGGVS